MTAVIRLADASFAAFTISSSSIRFRFTGVEHDCTRNTSAPRIDSPKRTYSSPFGNVFSSTSPSVSPRLLAMTRARSGFDRPENTIIRRIGSRSW